MTEWPMCPLTGRLYAPTECKQKANCCSSKTKLCWVNAKPEANTFQRVPMDTLHILDVCSKRTLNKTQYQKLESHTFITVSDNVGAENKWTHL